jgi:HAE1 family hydrophobic/amphiphilic exporter-1
MTTVLGLLPMVITFFGDQSAGAEIRAPMAITVMGGLIVSTFLTLIVVPVIYSLVTKDTSLEYEVSENNTRLNESAKLNKNKVNEKDKLNDNVNDKSTVI